MRIRSALAAALLAAGTAGLAGCAVAPPASPSTPWQSTTWAWVPLAHPVSGVGQDGVTVTERDSGRPIPALLLCKYGGSDVPCTSGRINGVRVLPTAPFQLGQYYRIGFASRLLDSGRPPISGGTDFRAGPREEDQGANPVYTWAQRSSAGAMGGSYMVEDRRDARASLTVPGSSITIWTATSNTHGLFDVYVDGLWRRTVNGYSPTTHWRVPVTLSGLSSGMHRVDVVALGTKGSAASLGTNVVVDGASWAGGGSDNPAFEFAWGSSPGAFSGGWVEGSEVGGARVNLTFRGTGVDVSTVRGPFSGTYQAYLDGRPLGRFDDSSTVYGLGTRHFAAPNDAVHQLSFVVEGRFGAHSVTPAIAVDYWQLADSGTSTMTPHLRVAPDDPTTQDRTAYLPDSVPPAPEKTVPAPADISNGATR